MIKENLHFHDGDLEKSGARIKNLDYRLFL